MRYGGQRPLSIAPTHPGSTAGYQAMPSSMNHKLIVIQPRLHIKVPWNNFTTASAATSDRRHTNGQRQAKNLSQSQASETWKQENPDGSQKLSRAASSLCPGLAGLDGEGTTTHLRTCRRQS